jgi:hypothetical protein
VSAADNVAAARWIFRHRASFPNGITAAGILDLEQRLADAGDRERMPPAFRHGRRTVFDLSSVGRRLENLVRADGVRLVRVDGDGTKVYALARPRTAGGAG